MINRTVNLSNNAGSDAPFFGIIENVTLTGTAALNATGDGGANHLTGNSGKNTLDGQGGSDTINGGGGDDKMTGGGAADTFDYNNLTDRGTGKDVITDFNAAEDKLDIHDLLVGIGGAADPYGGGFLHLIGDGKGNTLVQIDADGSAGSGKFATLVTLSGVVLADHDASIVI
jgi:Ca2+-binding RTX toxin-like protein